METNISKCMYCGSHNYGGGCSFSPSKLHIHVDDPERCIYCGSKSYGGGCAFNRKNNMHVHGMSANDNDDSLILNKDHHHQPLLEYGSIEIKDEDFGGSSLRESPQIQREVEHEDTKTIGRKINYFLKMLKIGDLDEVKNIIREGAFDINTMPEAVLLLFDDKPNKAKSFLRDLIDINSQNDWGYTALMFAVMEENIPLIKNLLGAGADPNAKNNGGVSILMKWVEDYDCTSSNMNIIKILLGAGVNLNAKDNKGNTVLFFANDDNIIKILLGAGANPNIKNKEGQTALFFVWSEKVIEVLLGAGINPNVKDNKGRTALMVGAEKEKNSSVKNLLDAGADPNIQDVYGFSALMIAAHNGDMDIVKDLLAHDANPRLKDKNGYNASYWALKEGHQEVAQRIRSKMGILYRLLWG